jgi:hypothetical protein
MIKLIYSTLLKYSHNIYYDYKSPKHNIQAHLVSLFILLTELLFLPAVAAILIFIAVVWG